MQTNLLYFLYITSDSLRWNSTMRRIQTSDRMQYFTVLKYKLHSFNIQDDRSTRGLLAKPLKNFQNHLHNGQPVASCRVFEWILIELHFNIIKNLLFFLFNGFITMCKLNKRLTRATFWVLLQLKTLTANCKRDY